MDSQSKYWCFTINNYTLGDVSTLESPDTWDKVPSYLIWQPEVGEKGTKHIQGYVCFSQRIRFSAMKKLLPNCHLEIRKGNHEQAKAYCKKDDTFDPLSSWSTKRFEFGDDSGIPSGPGKRTDLEDLQTDIKSGKRGLELWDDHFSTMVKYTKGVDRYLSLNYKRRCKMPEVYVYYGVSGGGKSFKAMEMTGGTAYFKMCENRWWDGFNPDIHKDVIVEDYRGQWGESYILRLCDTYPMIVEMKGATIELNFDRIFFTSNHHPKDWEGWGMGWDWESEEQAKHPFKRRIHELLEFKKIYKN